MCSSALTRSPYPGALCDLVPAPCGEVSELQITLLTCLPCTLWTGKGSKLLHGLAPSNLSSVFRLVGTAAFAGWVTQSVLIGVVVLSRIDWILGGAWVLRSRRLLPLSFHACVGFHVRISCSREVKCFLKVGRFLPSLTENIRLSLCLWELLWLYQALKGGQWF